MERRGVGIRELARQLNISIGTVSRALNGRGEVNPQTRIRVQEAAERLGYVPNQSGRTLRQGSTRSIALMMRISSDRMASGETFFMGLSEGLQDTLAPLGLDLVLLPSGPSHDMFEFLRRAVERQIADGFIVTDTQRTDPRIDYLIRRRIPFVALGRSLSGGPHPWVDLDFEGVVDDAVARFVKAGHRRIALGLSVRAVNNRVVAEEAYRKALAGHGLPFDPALVLRVPNAEGGGQELGSAVLALPDRPTALFVARETLAIGLYRRFAEAGLAVGRDLSLIGFRRNPSCQSLTPALTCYDLSLQKLGARLADILVAEIAGREEAAAPQELWPMHLVPGGSETVRG